MARYMLLFTNDATGAARMLDGLSQGFERFGDGVKRHGGSLEGLWALAGRYGAAAVVTFEQPEAVLSFCLTATAQGQQVEALPAFGLDEVGSAEVTSRAAATAFLEELELLVRSDEGAAQ